MKHQRRTKTARRDAARHESGHATVAHALGLRLHSLSIAGDEKDAGFCELATVGTIQQEIVVSLGGILALERHGGVRITDLLKAGDDCGRAYRYAMLLHHQNRTKAESVLAECLQFARAELAKPAHRAALQALAAALLQAPAGRLTGRQAERIIRRAIHGCSGRT